MELSLAVNASLVALSKYGGSIDNSSTYQRLNPWKPFSARNLLGFLSQGVSMSVVLTKLELSLPKTWCLKEWLVSSTSVSAST